MPESSRPPELVVFWFSGTGNTLLAARSFVEGAASVLAGARIVLEPMVRRGGDDEALARLMDGVRYACAFFPVYRASVPRLVASFLRRLCGVWEGRVDCVATMAAAAPGLRAAVEECSPDGRTSLLGSVIAPSNCLRFPFAAPAFLDSWLIDRLCRVCRGHGSHWASLRAGGGACADAPEASPGGEGGSRPGSRLDRLARALLRRLPGGGCDSYWADWLSGRFRVSDSCDGCGLCAALCPVGNIVVEGGRRAVHGSRCEMCLRCYQWCPRRAVSLGFLDLLMRRYTAPGVDVGMLEDV